MKAYLLNSNHKYRATLDEPSYVARGWVCNGIIHPAWLGDMVDDMQE